MSHEVFQPGQFWPGAALTRTALEEQWAVEFSQLENLSALSSIAFTDSSWRDLDWNAREALHLNNKWPKAPRIWRHLFLPQEDIDKHLIRSLQMLLFAWQHWIQLPFVRAIGSLPAAAVCHSTLDLAAGRFEQAKGKYASLQSRKKFLQQFSLRQWRLYQQVSAMFNDLEPLVVGSAQYGVNLDRDSSVASTATDIQWHVKELHTIVKRPVYKPSQMARLRSDRLRINQMACAACLYHSALLQELLTKK